MIPQRVHFVGIGGIGMSALARLLVARGHTVSGSDRNPGEQGADLAAMGVRLERGHRAEYVDGAELVVVTSAAAADNPEVLEARAHGIPVVKRAELLGEIVNAGCGIAVAGTHGKTTTSALISWILIVAELDPTVLIGGISANLGSNARVGGELVVAEADEYDASFLQLRPSIAVITNVEPDHLDFYGTPDRVLDAFRRFAAGVRDLLVVCGEDQALAAALRTEAAVVTYGIDAGEVRADEIVETGEWTSFRCGDTRFRMRLAGRHNVLNATAALTVARALQVPDEAIADALQSFSGVARRWERKGEAGGVLVMDDYAHHPTEVRVNLQALKSRFRRPVRVVFQPHTYSRTHDFLEEFACSFVDADAVYLLDIYAARETDTRGISGRDLAEATARRHPHVLYTETLDGSVDALVRDAQPGDLIVTMGAGDVYQLAPPLLSGLAGR